MPHFSLPNQPMQTEKSVAQILASCELEDAGKIGLIGWKNFTSHVEDNHLLFDLPYFLVEALKTCLLYTSLFVNAGYLTVHKTLDVLEDMYSLRIPNNEVARGFQSLTVFFLNVDETTVAKMFQALKTQNWDEFLKNYQKMLLESVSYYDLRNENSYHSLLLGMCTVSYTHLDVYKRQTLRNNFRYSLKRVCFTALRIFWIRCLKKHVLSAIL